LAEKCCFFREKYQDYKKGMVSFRCDMPQHENSNRCKFHLLDYVKNPQNRDDLIKSLKDNVARANRSGDNLMWIGYYLPKDFTLNDNFETIVFLEGANFLGNVDFSSSVFKKNVNFRDVTFNGKANFYKTTFEGIASFHNAKFRGEVSFIKAIFHQKTYFFSVTFNEAAYFSQISEFKDVANFTTAVFIKQAYFNKTTFKKQAHFTSAKFKGLAEFDFATFTLNAVFRYAAFELGKFNKTIFNTQAQFSNAVFNEVEFKDPTFNGQIRFSNAKFKERTFFFFGSMIGNVMFDYVDLEVQEQVLFNGNLSKVSFANTDVTRVRFGDKVVWRKEKESLEEDEKSQPDVKFKNKIDNKSKHWWYKDEIDFKIYDERIIEGEERSYEPPSSLEAIVTEYRNLRENYEYNLRYKQAGQFFVREMELRRRYEQKSSHAGNNKIEKKDLYKQVFSLSSLYYGISKYGESTILPLAIITGTFILATTIFFFFFQTPWGDPYLNSISRSLEAFLPFFNLEDDRGLGDMILRATMLPMVGLLFISLRRKLERRFRH
jgi:hypothetical protein